MRLTQAKYNPAAGGRELEQMKSRPYEPLDMHGNSNDRRHSSSA